MTRLALLVNPVAGMGGAVGLKGTDGADVLAEARARGAVPHAGERAAAAVRSFAASTRSPFVVLAAPGSMGAQAAGAAGVPFEIVGKLADGPTVAADTWRLSAALADAGADLLLFAGGDGTARDVLAGLGGRRLPVLGIPAGVKIQSAVYAVSPVAAGRIAAAHLSTAPGRRATSPREVVDLDEAALAEGLIAPRLAGELEVPVDHAVQARKSPAASSDAAAADAIGRELAARMAPGDRWILGPGSTVRAIATRLAVAKTLVGVDLVEIGVDGARVTVADAAESDLLVSLPAGPRVVVTPIGGQGFLFGRGNQQVSARVIGAILDRRGRDGIVVVATESKLAALAGRPLLVDTGDAVVDERLEGYQAVVTGRGERSICPVRRA